MLAKNPIYMSFVRQHCAQPLSTTEYPVLRSCLSLPGLALCYDQNDDLHMSTAWPFKLSSGECATIFQHLVGGWDTVPSFPRVLVCMWVGAWVSTSVLACMGVCLSACKHRSLYCSDWCMFSCHWKKSYFRLFFELRHGSWVGIFCARAATVPNIRTSSSRLGFVG